MIGTIRGECLDHMIVFNKRRLGRHFDGSQRISIATAFTGHWRRIPWTGNRSSDRSAAASSQHRYWADYISDTSGVRLKHTVNQLP